MSPLDKIAPYPKTADEATAEAMARHMTAFAQLHWRIAMDHPDRDKARESINSFTSYYGITLLLREIPNAIVADRVARELWEAWDSGQAIGADLWEWLGEYEIDPADVDAIAKQITEPNPDADTQTGMGGAA